MTVALGFYSIVNTSLGDKWQILKCSMADNCAMTYQECLAQV
jgi:hypothetical protein